jgi:hypothetical protein
MIFHRENRLRSLTDPAVHVIDGSGTYVRAQGQNIWPLSIGVPPNEMDDLG